MEQLITGGIIIVTFLIVLTAYSLNGFAQEVQLAETQGSIRFKGFWIDPSEIPDPLPPSNDPIIDIAKDKERLPQTNEDAYHWLVALGVCFIGYVLFVWSNAGRHTLKLVTIKRERRNE